MQALKARFASRSGNERQTTKRLLSGLIRCGACGGAMTIVNRERYSCSARRERGTCDSPAGIRAADLEARVLDGLRLILLGREDLVEEFAKAFKKELQHQLAAEPPHQSVEIHPNGGELYRRNVGALQTLLQDETTRTEAFDAIRSLIEQIEIHAGAKRGHPDVILVGALAAILDFASAGKSKFEVAKVLVVAGARFAQDPTLEVRL